MNFKTKRIPLTAMQKAVYTNLLHQTVDVYDHVPDDSACLPYITLGASTFKPCGPKDKDIYACSIQIHVWSGYEGKAETNEIMNDVSTILSSAALDMTADDFVVVWQEVTFFEAYESDSFGYHGVITFDSKIEDVK